MNARPNETPTCCPLAETDFRLGHRRWLDGLRGVAVLLVLAYHLGLIRGGAIGVDVFFVLSGFLITTLLVDEFQRRAQINLKRFYLRRILRLAPALVVLLVVAAAYAHFCRPAEEASGRWQEIIVVACYVSNWQCLHGVGLSILGHTWSLSVEEQFYLIWPVLLYLMLRNLSRQRILLIVGAGIVASASLRAFLHYQHLFFGAEPIHIARLYVGLDTRADSLLAGCLASLLVSWRHVPTSPRFARGIRLAAMIAAGILGFCLFFRDAGSSQFYDGLFTVAAGAIALVIVRQLAAPAGIGQRLLEAGPLVAVGRISYGLYLFHAPIFAWVGGASLGWRRLDLVIVALLLSFAAALLSFFLIERPFLRLKDALHDPQKATPAIPPLRQAA